MSTGTLYQIGADLDALEALLFDVGGDVSEDEASEAIDAWLAESQDALKEKLDSYGALIREFESRAAARKAEADRLMVLATVDANAVKRLKDRLRWFFEARGIDKVESARFRFTLANNGGKAPVDVLLPAEALPEWCQRVSVSADVDAIRAKLEAGEALEFAALRERGKHLRVK
jgi:hypothetical protein